ncbi:MAG: 6-hydroxymethylpterin diphosphokinase MptE-like protein [Syntrophomonas sp.]
MKQKPPVNPIYEDNLKALKENYPHIAERIEKAPVTRDYEMRGTGEKRFVNVYSRKHDFYFYKEDDPLKDVTEQMAALNLKNTKIAVFLGFGLGYEVKYFAGEMAGKLGTVKILIIERDLELFKTALNMFNYAPMMRDPNIKLVVGEDEKDLLPIFNGFFRDKSNVIYLKAMKPVYHSSSLRLYKEYYLKALKMLIEAGLYTLQFYGNSPEDSLVGVENMLDNTHEIVANPGINMLYGKFAGQPAVIVATGPSLNKNKHLLKGLEEKALIISVDASLRILIEMGIKPHLVTSLERIEETARLLEGFSAEQVDEVYLAACPVVRKEAYAVYPGPRIIVYRNFAHFTWLGVDKGILEIKQSAGNMGFKVAEALGCDPIILIGQDLAYARDGRTHALGTTFGENQELGPDQQLEVMGYDGEPIMTNGTWNSFRKAYEIDIAGYQGRCINCTEGGAYIYGTEVMPFQEAIDTYITKAFRPLALIKESIAGFSTDSIQNDIENLNRRIHTAINDLTAMKEHCKKAFETIRENESQLQAIIDQTAPPDGDFNVDQMYIEIVGHKDQIMNIQPTMQLFLMHIIQPYFIKFFIDLNELADLYDDENLLKAHIVVRYFQWFGVIHDIILICLASLDRAQKDIEELAASL